MRRIKEWIYKFDNVNVRSISILGGIGFSVLFTIVLTITTLLGMLIITPALETLGSIQENLGVVQIINGISEIGVQICLLYTSPSPRDA